MLLVSHYNILQTTDVTSKAFRSKATDLWIALKCLEIWNGMELEELENYRYEFVNFKMEANSVAEWKKMVYHPWIF